MRMNHRLLALSAALTLFAFTGTKLSANTIIPTSYKMVGGETDDHHYWDWTYTGGSGPQTADDQHLYGGKGLLTDGQPASGDWDQFDAHGNPDYLQYVGWYNNDADITFDFARNENISSVTIYYDDPVEGRGGVRPPYGGTIKVGSTTETIDSSTFTPKNAGPTSATIAVGLTGSWLELTLQRSPNDQSNPIWSTSPSFGASPDNWIMISEVRFGGSPAVPATPAVYGGTGLFALLLLSRFYRAARGA